MELRIENGRGKWRTVKSPNDKFYKALDDAMADAAYQNRKLDPDRPQDFFYPVVSYGSSRVFVTKITGSHAHTVDRPVDTGYAAWLHVGLLTPAGEKPKREVSPERREKLAKNLEKARAARRSK